MSDQNSINTVRETFESSFDKARFVYFVKNLFNEYEDAPITRTGQYIPDAYSDYVSKYERIGKYEDSDEKRIDILIVYLKKETSIERARSMQRNFIAGYLKGNFGTDSYKDAALVAFVAPNGEDWRFSLVKLEVKLDADDDGKIKLIDEFTPARRWSFLVGSHEKSHTAQRQFQPILEDIENNPTLGDLEGAFNIEKVTDEFFREYRRLFIDVKSALDKAEKANPKTQADFESKGIDTVNLAKKLMGQIVFLYYLQKKGWFGVPKDGKWGEGSKNFLRELFEKKHGDYEDFFNDVLEPLFYDALRMDRSDEDYYYKRFKCKIPFLNGGLFDPMGNYNWEKTVITLSNSLFSNKTKNNPEGDGILDVFDLYNFTVNEDEPFEKEVAIDPELLGKAYEKFNAIRPDNYDEFLTALKSGKKGDETKFNKQYGVYYTPREIVHYMCQQSLINYLATELDDTVSKDDLATLIQQGENLREHEARAESNPSKKYQPIISEEIRDHAVMVDNKLAAIKVCDPAVGSGAFPVGMMSEIVRAREVLKTWTKTKKTVYDFKRQCIENSLYGVDIDAGAVEIAKLRLWLSLIVDEDDIQRIRPLPNLDYKIVQGNSLIEVLTEDYLVADSDVERTKFLNQLKSAKDELFNLTSSSKKELKRREIESLMQDLFENYRSRKIRKLKEQLLGLKGSVRLAGFSDAETQKAEKIKVREIEGQITELQNLRLPDKTEHFEWHIIFSDVFDEKQGFDVVIGNPPYYSLDTTDTLFKEQLQKTYPEIFSSQGNIYFFFINKSILTLRKCGVLIFINENYYLSSKNAQRLRKYLLENSEIIALIDFRNVQLFENVNTLTIINSFKKTLPRGNAVSTLIVDDSVKSLDSQGVASFLSSNPYLIKQTNLDQKQWLLIDSGKLSLKAKIDHSSTPLIDCVDMGQGMTSGNNSVFIVSKEQALESGLEKDILKKYVKTQDIKPYSILYRDLLLIYITKEQNINKYPSIKKYLTGYKENLLNRFETRSNPERWFAISVQRNPSFFEDYQEKILTPLYSKGNKFAYDDCKRNNYFVLTDVYVMVPKSNIISLKYLLGLLNSKLLNYYVISFGKLKRDGYYEYSKNTLSNLPIKRGVSYQHVIALVDRILAAKGGNPQADTSALEREIDQLVYELYGLTEDEVKIVEGKS